MTDNSQLNRRTQEVFVLARIAEFITSLDLDDVLTNTLSLLTETIGAERGSFFLFNEHTGTAERYITRRNLPPERSQTVVEKVLEEGLAGWVYRHKQGALIHDTFEDERWVIFPDDPSPVRSVMCVPFIADGRINGIMTLEHAEPNHFLDDDLRLATAVGNQASIALRNAQLFNQVESHERQLQAVLQSTVDAILTFDIHGEIMMVNPAAQALLGLPTKALVGRKLADITDKPIITTTIEHLQARDDRFEVRDEESERDYIVHVSTWQDSETEEMGRVIVFNDITPFKEVDRIKSQMLQIASHDLKNPLGVILGYSEMMLMELDPMNAHYEFVADISKVTQRMLDMVTQLLDVERIESSAAGAENHPFDPLVLIEDVVSELRTRAEQKQQALLTELPTDSPPVLGDAAQLREAFKNLVDNAIKYTPDGGKVVVRAAVDHDHGRFHYSVMDNGYGIAEELQDKMFQRFYRAKQPGTEHISGTGLGLSLVKAVIERHGGEIWFKSEPGKGSVFGFWLPLKPAA